jgi:hypothetical protein
MIISVLKSRTGISPAVNPHGMTGGDFLNGFALGTAKALCENDIPEKYKFLSAEYEIGALNVLYELAVGFYARMADRNAYQQRRVEVGKNAAAEPVQIQRSMGSFLAQNKEKKITIDAIADGIDLKHQKALVFKLLTHMAANDNGITGNLSVEILLSISETICTTYSPTLKILDQSRKTTPYFTLRLLFFILFLAYPKIRQ